MSPEAGQPDARSRQAGFNAGHPIGTQEPLEAPQSNEPSARFRLVYGIVGLIVLLYLAGGVAFAGLNEPNLQFFAYYAVNYDQGFVRRGLGGEILGLFPADSYFTGLLILRWLVTALFGAGIAAVAWAVALKFGRSERRLMLALLIPMLPLGVAHAVVLPTPDLVGEAVLAVFAVVLTSVKTRRSLLVASGIYGMATAVLTLIHEAIPFLQSLGAILAIVVLADRSARVQRLAVLFAVAPGLGVALAIAVLRRRDVSSQCPRLPHRPIEWASGQSVDYHDWTCRFITVTSARTPFVGANFIGWTPFIASTIAGIVILVLTVVLIGGFSSVPFGQFRQALRGRLSLVTMAALLLLPVFATSADWTRWWVAISFDVGVVYVLYASRQPESARPATRRTRISFLIAMVLLALFPILVGLNAEQSLQQLQTRCSQLVNDPMWVGICP